MVIVNARASFVISQVKVSLPDKVNVLQRSVEEGKNYQDLEAVNQWAYVQRVNIAILLVSISLWNKLKIFRLRLFYMSSKRRDMFQYFSEENNLLDRWR